MLVLEMYKCNVVMWYQLRRFLGVIFTMAYFEFDDFCTVTDYINASICRKIRE